MSMVHRLIEQLERRGLRIAPGTERDTLLLHGPASEKTPEVIDAVKKFKPQLLKIYQPEPIDSGAAPEPAEEHGSSDDPEDERCSDCGRPTDPEDRTVLATNHYLCELATCPYKATGRRNRRAA